MRKKVKNKKVNYFQLYYGMSRAELYRIVYKELYGVEPPKKNEK